MTGPTVKVRSAMKAYGQTRDAGNSQREQELQAFISVINRLETAMNAPENRGAYYEAIADNQRLWMAVKLSALDPDHELPERVKKNLLSLGLFMDSQAKNLLKEFKPAELKTIIDINRSITLGLQGVTPEQKQAF